MTISIITAGSKNTAMVNVRIETALGAIDLEIDDERAPRTAAHFLSYVDDGYYSGASFYRSLTEGNQPFNAAKIRVIEGGYLNGYYEQALRDCFANGFDAGKGHFGPKPMISVEPTSETGVSHVDGTVSLGRTSKDAVDDSFFICVGDQPHLDYGGERHEDGFGFSAFGIVTEGMDVVREINRLATDGQKIIDEVRIISITRRGPRPQKS